MSTANAIPTASIFTVGSGLITKLVKTTIMMRAAVVITLVELRGGLGGQHRRTQCVAVPFGDEHGAEAGEFSRARQRVRLRGRQPAMRGDRQTQGHAHEGTSVSCFAQLPP